MSRKLQQVLYGLLTLVFVVGATTYALFYANGNRFDPQQGGITRTGTIRLNINPDVDVSASLDGEPVDIDQNDRVIDNIPSGTYSLSLDNPDYNSWQQDIAVRAGLVTDISVQLFPAEFEFEQLTATNVDSVVISDPARTAYYLVKDSPIGANVGIWQLPVQESNLPIVGNNSAASKITNLTPQISRGIENQIFRMIPSPNERNLLIQTAPNEYHILRTGSYNEPDTNNLHRFAYPVDRVAWLTDTSLIIESDNLLLDYSIEDRSTRLIQYFRNNNVYTVAGNTVYTVERDQLVSYSSGISQTLELENTSLPDNITSLQAGKFSPNQLIIGAADELYYLSLEESLLTKLGKYVVRSIAPSGTNLIVVEKGTNRTLALEIDVSKARNLVEINDFEISNPEVKTADIYWANNSKYFVFASETGEVITFDRSGQNSASILNLEQSLNATFIASPSDNSGLILLLRDSQTGQNTERRNIYRLEF